MPGDATLVDEFAARLEPPLLRDLFRKMVGEMRLAGDLGTLLRVEEGIAAELTRAREQFVKAAADHGFLPGMEPAATAGRAGPFGHRRRQLLPRGRGAHRRCAAALCRSRRRRRERAPTSFRGRRRAGHRAYRSRAHALRRGADESAVRRRRALPPRRSSRTATRALRTTSTRPLSSAVSSSCTRTACSARSLRARASSCRASRSGARRSS